MIFMRLPFKKNVGIDYYHNTYSNCIKECVFQCYEPFPAQFPQHIMHIISLEKLIKPVIPKVPVMPQWLGLGKF